MNSPEEMRLKLKRSGWSLGEFATLSGYHVEGTRGENHIRGEGSTPPLAWRRAALAASLFPTPDPTDRCRPAL